MQTGRMVIKPVKPVNLPIFVAGERYRTGGTGVGLIGLTPDLSPWEGSDRRLIYAIQTDQIFTGDNLTFSAYHDGTSMENADPPTPNWADGDEGFGLWYFHPDLFYGKTATNISFGNEAGMAYRITFRADGPSGWAEIDFQIKIPAEGEIAPKTESGLGDIGPKNLSPGDTIVDVASFLRSEYAPSDVAKWQIFADPTMMSGTPTFRMDGSVLKLHWPSVDYTGETIRIIISGTTSDGNHLADGGLYVDVDLTASAVPDPGPPAGWTLPPYPGAP